MSEPVHIGKLAGQIIQGHTNKALSAVGLLGSELEKLSELRFADCLLCDHTPHPTKPGQNGPGLRGGKYCDITKGGCGCDMEAKTKVKTAQCPIGRW